MSGRQKFYITTAISYPNGAAAHRPRLRGDRHRRHRALRAARRQGRVLPHRHRRARPQDEADGRQGGPDAARARRPQLGALPRDGGGARPVQRRLHPHHRAAPLRGLRRDLAAHGGGRRHLPEEVRRLVLGARGGLSTTRARRRSATDGVRREPARHAGRVDGGGDLLLPPVGLPGQAARALRGATRTSSCRPSGATRS